MKIAFITNYYNHHQKFLADSLFELTEHNYYFIETEQMTEERLQLGWGQEKVPEYVIKNYVDSSAYSACQRIIDEADVVICGSAPYDLIRKRLSEKKLVFGYSERIYKKKEPYKWPVRLIRHFLWYGIHQKMYMLCASAYTAADYAKTGTFINKAYKFGYFTEVKKYDDIDRLIDSKKKNSILWVARLISLKHPEAALYVAKKLKAEGYDFSLTIIGDGVLYPQIKKQIEENKLEDCVFLTGALSPEQVRAYMEESEIFLFTSDRNEGWGAVLNEAMNSACAVVASHAIGSVPFLIKDKENGLIYRNGNYDDLYEQVKLLLNRSEERHSMGRNAYLTMANEWNAFNAAKRLIELSARILEGEKSPMLFKDGVCSRAERINDDWFK